MVESHRNISTCSFFCLRCHISYSLFLYLLLDILRFLLYSWLFVLNSTLALTVYFCRKKSKELDSRVEELQSSLRSSLQKCSAERQGRIRAQQALRKELAQSKSESVEQTSYPMTPIGVVQSCFSTRNGTPRQPLLVPLARACLVFNPTRVPTASLEGLADYTHCWIIYVFHLNTDLEKLWRQPTRSKFKAKVRVPRLKGRRIGVFATRSPHRPCPIGLTVAKVEAIHGNIVLLSGVDLVDGTPILDVKPYLPYCDSIPGAAVPKWVMMDDMLAVASVSFSDDFPTAITNCWKSVEKKSLYASPQEFQCLVKEVLSWDIRSVSQRTQPHDAIFPERNGETKTSESDGAPDSDSHHSEEEEAETETGLHPSDKVIYHLILEGIDVSYRIESSGKVVVEKAMVSSNTPPGSHKRCNYLMWKDGLSVGL
ncbi:hypothetical protein K2173_016134 [Erythroxylum novogranatense]|uniref:TsaA-like domain-containing protein n=1 Tax=Erythroxylum novogranatense TaxID=1862640 RepID=A0AAV8SFX0_9ROSI|nr:hypothetical protein K2173_016134 [Erythroxylum novogranatense]